jgi:hypothetical protein
MAFVMLDAMFAYLHFTGVVFSVMDAILAHLD